MYPLLGRTPTCSLPLEVTPDGYVCAACYADYVRRGLWGRLLWAFSLRRR